jgi:hypothetical protein
MEQDEARQTIEEIVSTWYAARVTEAAQRFVEINTGGFDNAARTAYTLAIRLHDKLMESDGIDAHKEAAVMAFAVGTNFSMFVHFSAERSTFTEQRYKENLRADCALTVYLAMLDVDRSAIESESITFETLRAMFLLVSTNNFPGDTVIAMLIALSTLAFALERTYPQSEDDAAAVL